MRKISLLCIVILGAGCMLAQAEPAAPVSVTEFSVNSANAQNAELGVAAPKQIRPGTFARLHPEALKGGARQGGEDCASAYPITSLPFNDTGTTTGYAHDYDEVCPYGGGTAPDVVYSYYAAADIYLTVDLCATTAYDTKTYIYEDDCISANLVACNDDACGSDGYKSRLSDIALTGGHTYYIVIDGYGTSEGEYVLLVIEGDEPPPLPVCPEGSLFAQEPVLPDGAWTGATSEVDVQGSNYQRFDNYSVEGLICDLHWWGSTQFHDGAWQVCEEDPMPFVIGFYADEAGAPAAAPTCIYEVTVAGTPTGQFYGDAEAYAYDLILDPCCDLPNGWISIQGAGDPNCWFMWRNSEDGDGNSLFYFNGAPEEPATFDLAFCLTGEGTPGACCDDTTGVCEDGIMFVDCVGRWAGGLCVDLVPACGDATGACCYPEDCQIQTYAECVGDELCPGDMDCSGMVDFDDIDLFVEALGYPGGVGWPYDCPWLNGDCNGDGDVTFDDIDPFVARIGQPCDAARDGGIWLGPGTTCDMCPCALVCPPGAVAEGEPCGDDTNGGCNSEPAVFEPITCNSPGNTVCGTAWATTESRDTDWYQLDLDDCYEVTITLASEFAAAFGMIEQYGLGAPGCDNITGFIDPFGTTNDCEEASITTICLPPGTYYIFVGPAAFYDLDCELGADYYLSVSCQTCPCCEVDCVGTPEGEDIPCAPDVTNGGCNMATPEFGEIDCDETICGTSGTFVDGEDNLRDMDWFKFVGSEPADPNNGYEITFTVEAEFEANIWVIVSTSGCDTIDTLYFASGARCTPISVTTGCLPIIDGVEYYFVVAPSSFVGVPCGAEYAASLSCTPCSVCSIIPADPAFDEGEACGLAEGEPGENGGCNNDVPTFTTFPAPWGDIGTTWVNGLGWADDNSRDTDWYTVTLAQSSEITWAAQAEFPPLVGIIYPGEMGVVDCDDYVGMIDGWGVSGGACELDVGVTVIVPAGEYMLFIAPSSFEGAPCGFAGNRYKARLTVAAHDYFDCNVTNTPGLNLEGEVDCGDNYVDAHNGGCDFTPNVFQTISCTYPDDGFFGRVGTFNGGLGRDTDWFEITLDDFKEIGMAFNAEFDLSLDIYDAALGCEADPIASYYGPMCEEQHDPSPCLAAGTYWIKIYPSTTQPDAIPCDNADRGAYWLWIEACTECDLDCVPACDPAYVEDEVCGEDPDANPGCNGGAFSPFTADNTWYCGTTFVNEEVTLRDVDWWMMSGGPVAVDTDITVELISEVPGTNVLIYDEGCPNGGWYYSYFHPECEVSSLTVTILSGYEAIVPILPMADGGAYPTDPYPCGVEGLNDYRFRATLAAAAPVQAEDEASTSNRPAKVRAPLGATSQSRN